MVRFGKMVLLAMKLCNWTKIAIILRRNPSIIKNWCFFRFLTRLSYKKSRFFTGRNILGRQGNISYTYSYTCTGISAAASEHRIRNLVITSLMQYRYINIESQKSNFTWDNRRVHDFAFKVFGK